MSFHRRLPSYAPTPLIDARQLAAELGVGRVLVKNESSRLGLPALKMLGASWAWCRALSAELERLTGHPIPERAALDDLAAHLAPLLPADLAIATDGNHGRAVARFARMVALGARIFVPARDDRRPHRGHRERRRLVRGGRRHLRRRGHPCRARGD